MTANITGPKIIFEIPLLKGIDISETIVNSWIVMALITILCLILTHGLKTRNPGKKQLLAEFIVIKADDLVKDIMGDKYVRFSPYILTLFIFSAFSSLTGLIGLRPPTADLNTTLGWSIVTFVMIQANNIRCNGIIGWIKSFTHPVAVMTPLNIVSEIANPISMSFRHFGNIAAGVVITALVYAGLAALSKAVIGWIPNDFISGIPIFQAGLPAVLSIYFDLFTSILQAYIICMLTMVFVAGVAE